METWFIVSFDNLNKITKLCKITLLYAQYLKYTNSILTAVSY